MFLLLLLLSLLFFFFSFGGVLASGDARVLEPLRDTSVISKLGLGHSPCSGEEDSGKDGGIGFFNLIFFLLLLGLFVANTDLFFLILPSCSFFESG